MSNKTPSLSLGGKPLMVALSVLAVTGAAGQATAASALNCDQGIEFGTLAACGVANTMTIEPDGGLTTSGCLAPVGNVIAGQCILTGIEVTTTTAITVVGPGNLSNGGTGLMAVDNFLLQGTASTAAVTVINITPSMNNLNFGVGATLHVGATQAGGTYTGTYTINTNYP